MRTTAHLICLLSVPLASFAAGIEYIGRATVPGSSLDLSGLSGTITWPSGSMPHNQLGGFGSGIAYTGVGNLFVGVNDRRPGDGAAFPAYFDRFQLFTLTPDVATKSIEFKLMSTPLMVNEQGLNFDGNSCNFSMRFDPEAVAVGKDGTYYVSDEYGPNIFQFDASGKRIRTIQLPAKYATTSPSSDAAVELAAPAGRQPNRGMEGLTISPDGKYLYGIMQNALIQDNALDASLGRISVNNRIIRIDLQTGEAKEYFYQLEGTGSGRGVNEILAVNDHQFLVLERDNKTPASSGTVRKKIFLIDVDGATDVSNETLPATGNGGFTPVSKSAAPFLDLMSFPEFAADFPEKIEGLTFGGLLPDGRLLLYVSTDNDFVAANSSNIYGFALDLKQTGLDYQRQLYAPEPATFGLAGAALALMAGRSLRASKSRRP